MEFNADFRISSPLVFERQISNSAIEGSMEVGGVHVTQGGGGKDGKDGKSAYEIAVKNGFEGTEAEWLKSLHGKDGKTPVKGTDYWTEEDKEEIVADVLEQITESGGGNPDVAFLVPRVEALEQKVDQLDKQLNPYVNIVVTPQSIGTYEMGTTVNEVTVKRSVNKTPQILTISGPGTDGTQTLSNNATSYTVPDKQLGINMNNANNFRWTIAATGEEGEVSSKQSPVIGFQNQVYWGAAAMPETINSAFVRGLSGKKLTGSKVTSFSANAGADQYIWYCLPVRPPFGTCTFKVGGFEGGFALATTEPIEFENASGYTEPYYVYRSDEINLGNTSVGVS
jgi:hypothetical protein